MKSFVSKLSALVRLVARLLGLIASVHVADEPRTTYYHTPLSYSTTRDPDPPKYSRPAEDTGVSLLSEANWLDIGLDCRLRYEYRDGDIRRPDDRVDQPFLHRTRAYLGIHDLIDPLRFAFEVQDSRRNNGHYPPDNRDVNEFAIIRLYGEFYLADLLGHDTLGNPRPFSLRYGIHNFEFLDRRLIGNNQWRNTANAFQGFHSSLGQESNDWQLDLLAVQPLERNLSSWDDPVEGRWLYAAIGHWRGWSPHLTLEPYYLALAQSAHGTVAQRLVHSPGLRAYGNLGTSGFDYDASFTAQFGRNGTQSLRAWGGNIEIGYTLSHHPWRPRLSAFYGYASGDRDPLDHQDNRFERFYGFGRPWSANDYIIYENISAPKIRLEAQPTPQLRFDLGYNLYFLASDTDRFIGAQSARDPTGRSGPFIGHEFDARIRYQLRPKTEIILGYAHFIPGRFTETQVRPGDTDFAYLEISQRFF